MEPRQFHFVEAGIEIGKKVRRGSRKKYARSQMLSVQPSQLNKTTGVGMVRQLHGEDEDCRVGEVERESLDGILY